MQLTASWDRKHKVRNRNHNDEDNLAFTSLPAASTCGLFSEENMSKKPKLIIYFSSSSTNTFISDERI